eukprot:gene6652-6722_t
MSGAAVATQSALLPRLLTGFAAGAISVLTFHAGAWYLLHTQGMMPLPFPMNPTQPLGIPQIGSLAFFGGLYGILLAWAWPRLPGSKLIWGFLLGVLAITVATIVVRPLKGQPIVMPDLTRAISLNCTWGVGVAIWFMLLNRGRSR